NTTLIRPGRQQSQFLPSDARHVSTDKDGKFEFPAVIAGEWYLVAETLVSGNLADQFTRRRYGSEMVRVGRRDGEGVELQLRAPFALPVQIDWGGAAPAMSTDVPFVGMISVQPEAGGGAVGGAITDEESAELKGLIPGRYRVSAWLLKPTHYIASI